MIVPLVAPGGRWEAKWSIEIQDTRIGVTEGMAEIARLQALGPATIHKTPQGRFSAVSPKC